MYSGSWNSFQKINFLLLQGLPSNIEYFWTKKINHDMVKTTIFESALSKDPM